MNGTECSSEANGFAFWTNHINSCGTDAVCTRSRRVGTSAAFFIEQEFQQSGYFVYRLYNGAYGRRPLYGEFVADRSRMVGGPNLEHTRRRWLMTS